MKHGFDLLFPNFFENGTLKKRLAVDIENSGFFHSVMLVGKDGCGKKTLAYNIAAALSCENRDNGNMPLPCGECDSCRKILSGVSADVEYIGREGHESLGVDSVRGFRSDAFITANDSDRKVYILDDVHTMTVQAQNAALKILEEPPKNVYFILLTENTQNILDTIMSRVMCFSVEPLADETLKLKLKKLIPELDSSVDPDSTEFSEIVRYSHGSLGRGIEVLSAKPKDREEMLADYRLPGKLAETLCTEGTSGNFLNLAEKIPDERQALCNFFDDLAEAGRDIIAAKNSVESLAYYISDTDLSNIIGRITLKRAFKMSGLALEMSRLTSENVNIQLIKSRFIYELRRIFNSL